MQTHVKVVGVLYIVLSALGLLLALGIGAMFGIAGAAADSSPAASASSARRMHRSARRRRMRLSKLCHSEVETCDLSALALGCGVPTSGMPIR